MKFYVVLACLLAAALAEEGSPKCTPSPTTASGSQARAGPYCSGDLIFEDNFNHLDFEKWEHENTLAGGGVSSAVLRIMQILVLIKHTFFLFRTGSSSGTLTTELIHTARMASFTSVQRPLPTILARAS